MNINHTCAIIFDGIHNTVFYAQLLKPMIDKRNMHGNVHTQIISFEKQPKSIVTSGIYEHANSTYIIHQRIPYIGCITLLPAILTIFMHIIKLLCYYRATQKTVSITLLARGPFAAYALRRAWQMLPISIIPRHITLNMHIQIRGIAAEEYRLYPSQFGSWLQKKRYRQLNNLEKKAYAAAYQNEPITFEAASNALADYAIATYRTTQEHMQIAPHRLPPPLPPTIRRQQRIAIRKQLGIAPDARVFVYSGSTQPWQCIAEMIDHFTHVRTQNKKAHLLLLTPDIDTMKAYIQHYQLDVSNYTIMSVLPTEVVTYVCAADYGYLLRKPHIVNWTSMPTKLQDYYAAEICVLHNQTVAYIVRGYPGKTQSIDAHDFYISGAGE